MKTESAELKKTFLLFIYCFILIFFCSCSSNTQKNTFFVHSICFDGGEKDINVIFLLEKHGKNNEYFTASYSAPTIKEAAKKATAEYNECYFATCDLYFISSNTTSDTISNIAKDICDSNIYPTTANILCIRSDSVKKLMENIKKTDDILKIKKNTLDSKTNVVSFFARFYSGKPVTSDVISLKRNKITIDAKATFTKGSEAVLHESKKR